MEHENQHRPDLNLLCISQDEHFEFDHKIVEAVSFRVMVPESTEGNCKERHDV